MGHSVSKQTTAAGNKQAAKAKEVLSPEKAIAEIRNLRAGKLVVGNMEYVDLLLAEYDKEKASVILLGESTAALLARAEAAEAALAEQKAIPHGAGAGAWKAETEYPEGALLVEPGLAPTEQNQDSIGG